jgi:hypothetical protein
MVCDARNVVAAGFGAPELSSERFAQEISPKEAGQVATVANCEERIE